MILRAQDSFGMQPASLFAPHPDARAVAVNNRVTCWAAPGREQVWAFLAISTHSRITPVTGHCRLPHAVTRDSDHALPAAGGFGELAHRIRLKDGSGSGTRHPISAPLRCMNEYRSLNSTVFSSDSSPL